jgi:Uma2 family endonuclease
MTTMTTLPRSRPLTYDDLQAMPDDGHRYELVDGTLVVTPAPSNRHQGAVGRFHLLLAAACPPELAVRLAPFEVKLSDDTVVQPDLIVTRRSDLTDRNLPVAPLLAVEVLSPSTRLFDLNLKKARYEQAGCASYWVFDPLELELVVWELREGRYDEVLRLSGEETGTVSTPYEMDLRPVDLVD